MSTAVIAFDRSKLAVALRQTSQEAAPSSTFLRLSKVGEWVYGAEADEVPEGAQFLVNPAGFTHGFIAWGEGARLGETNVLVTEPLGEPGPVPAGARGWEFQLGCHLKGLTGETKDTELVYRASSVGGKRAIATLSGLVAKKLSDGGDDFVPVVTLDVDSYKHAQYGKIFTPVLKIVKWVKMPTAAAPAAPAKKSKKK